jgi:hypothetical protein
MTLIPVSKIDPQGLCLCTYGLLVGRKVMTTLQLRPLHTGDSHWTSVKLNGVKKVQDLAKPGRLTIHYGQIRATVILRGWKSNRFFEWEQLGTTCT